MPTVGELNAMDRATFVARLGAIYEHSPWVADAAWLSRPFGSAAQLHSAMQEAVLKSEPAKQLQLVRAHPQLLGRLARPEQLTAASRHEQAASGLDRCSADELDSLHRLNRAYSQRFGFPFVIAVRGLDPAQVIAQMTARLNNGAEQELMTCLNEIGRIARFRLEDLVTP
jgi:2-oxo-4-hydroxy-4-carboxy-5-ureidoimidazoline decarboxylase